MWYWCLLRQRFPIRNQAFWAASGPAAMMFSNTQWIGTKDSYIHGMVIFVINMLVTIIGVPIAQLLF